MNNTLILSHQQINHKLERMAWQLWETNHEAKSIYIVGIEKKGLFVAKLLKDILSSISPIEVHLITLILDKKNLSEDNIKLNKDVDLFDKSVVLVDDVLNSGKTLMYACMELMKRKPLALRTAILANRAHARFPIKADFVGISLSTTLQEHITFDNLKQDDLQVFLS